MFYSPANDGLAHPSAADPTLYDFMFSDTSTSHFAWFIDSASGHAWTGTQIKERTDALALGLQAHLSLGLSDMPSCSSRGDVREVVSLITPNDIDFGVVVWAAHRIGCTVSPSNSGSTAQELEHQFRLSGASAIVAHPSAAERASEAARSCGIAPNRVIILSREEVDGDLTSTETLIHLGRHLSGQGRTISERPTHSLPNRLPRVAFLCFSSGTTGLPKAVIVPHSAVIANVLQVRESAVPRSRATAGVDRALGVVPFSHMYGLLHLVHLCPLLGIATVAYPSLPHPFPAFLDSLATHNIGHLFLAPPLVSAFVKHPACAGRTFGAHFKSAMVAAAPLDAATEDAFRSMCGPDFLFSQVFGMTETAGLVTALPEGEAPRSGSVSRLVARSEAKVVAEDGAVVRIAAGAAVGATVRGELYVRGPQLCLGYLDNEEATSATFDEEGFLRTGDMVEVSPEGDISVVDRLKHIIKCKGFQVSPAELEGHLLQSEYVRDAGVIGRADVRSGEVPVAFVVLTDAGNALAASSREAVEMAIKLHVQQAKSQHKWLAEVFIIDTIPKLPSGKILVRELRKRLPSAPVKRRMLPHAGDSRLSGATLLGSISESEKKKYKLSVASSIDAGMLFSEKTTVAHLEVDAARDAREKRADAAPTVWESVCEWLTLYRFFHATVLTFNAIGAGLTLAHRWPFGREFVATFALINVLASLLARNEIFLRLLYQLCLFLFKRWPPLFIREIIASFLLHIGGLHSGFAIGGTLWMLAAVINFFQEGPHVIHASIMVLSLVTCITLVVVCASAWPSLRNNHHNTFENLHRLGGWSGLAILWVVVVLADSWDPTPPHQFRPARLAYKPDIYLAAVLTILIAVPWMTVRKVEVDARVLSRSVVQLRFPGRGYGVGLFGRISRHPLRENHAFGITSMGPDSGEHYMLVVGQGDFTRDLIARPPTHIYTRAYKFVGLPYMVNMYRSGLYVVTGTAIGVALSVFLQPDPRSRWHLLWVASRIEDTYRDTALADLRAAFARRCPGGVFDEAAFERMVTIWDTRVRGRPNLMQLIEERCRAVEAEVVFVTSNPQGTSEILRGCRKRSIPAHGPVWDS